MTSVVIGKVGDIPPGERKIVVPFRGRAGIGVFKRQWIVLRRAQHLSSQERSPLHRRAQRSRYHRCTALYPRCHNRR